MPTESPALSERAEEDAISTPSVARSTATMSVATTLSRITGFARTWATAFALGATTLASSYNVANNIPNMIFELVAGGILSALFIPTFMEVREERGEEAAWRFASHVFNLAALALGAIAVVGTVFPAPFIWTQTFRLPADEAQVIRTSAEFFFRFFAVQVLVYGAGMVVQGLLNANRRYLWPALGPVFNNLVVIATMFTVAWIGARTSTGLVVLAVGTTLGVVAMFAVMLPDLVKLDFRYTPELGLSDPAVRRMLVLAVPTVIYVFTNLVAVSFRNASAFAVADNGPSIVMYAWNFYQLPYGILAVALATAVFTELSAASGRKDIPAFKKQFGSGLRSTIVLMLPAAAALIALATPLVSLYLAGAFRPSDVPPVASVLRWWGGALVFYATTMYVLRTFYSLKDTRTPMLVNAVLTTVQVSLYMLLTTGFRGWSGFGIAGIPIADGIFYAAMLAALLTMLRRKIGAIDLTGAGSTFVKMAVASAAGGAVAFFVARALAPLAGGIPGALLQVLAGGVLCLGMSFVLGHLLGVREVSSATSMVRRAGSNALTRGRKRD